jgi:ribosome assembly protein YihI (activator of Der GTPase)
MDKIAMFRLYKLRDDVTPFPRNHIDTINNSKLSIMKMQQKYQISNNEMENALLEKIFKGSDGSFYQIEYVDSYIDRLYTDTLLENYGDRLDRDEIANELNIKKKSVDKILERAMTKLKNAGVIDEFVHSLAELYRYRNLRSCDIDVDIEVEIN